MSPAEQHESQPQKCKIMIICPLKTKPVPPMLSINNFHPEDVSSYKVLGLTLSDTFEWNDNTNDIVSKASRRLHILRVLKRAGVPPVDFVTIYSALVRSLLEYSSVVWVPALLASSLTSLRLSRRGTCESYILTSTVNMPLCEPTLSV